MAIREQVCIQRKGSNEGFSPCFTSARVVGVESLLDFVGSDCSQVVQLPRRTFQ